MSASCGTPPCVRGSVHLPLIRAFLGRYTPVRTGISTARDNYPPAANGTPPCVRGSEPLQGERERPQRYTPVRTGISAPLPS